MPRKRGESKGKYLAISAIVIIIVVIAIAVAVNNSNPAKVPVSQYLEITHTISMGEFYNQNNTVKITYLGLDVTAVGGDAQDIIIIVRSHSEDLGPEWKDFLAKGESWAPGGGTILLQGYVTSLNEDGLFPVKIRIGCAEAITDDVTIYLKPEDIVSWPVS